MRGTVLDYDAATGHGIVSGEDGERYAFAAADLRGDGAPRTGAAVDFRAEAGRAGEVYVTAGASGARSKWIAGLLAIVLGGLGVHKFYLGFRAAGIIMLATWLIGWLLLGVTSAIISLIAFVEGVIYLVKDEDAFDRDYVRGDRAWL
jgi:TM2 domain-containing membrane protein YozV